MDTGWKILIDGHQGSGVDSFIKTVCDHKPGTTGRLLSQLETGNQNLGKITVDRDVVLSFFGNSTSHDGWGWDDFDQHLLGVLIIFDSTKPQVFEEIAAKARELSEQSPVSYILVANKQDFSSAVPVDEIRAAMHLPGDAPLMPCVATDRQSVREVLVTLLKQIQSDIDRARLNARE